MSDKEKEVLENGNGRLKLGIPKGSLEEATIDPVSYTHLTLPTILLV